MLDMVGEAVDRLITIEAKNRGMPHGILQPMYLPDYFRPSDAEWHPAADV